MSVEIVKAKVTLIVGPQKHGTKSIAGIAAKTCTSAQTFEEILAEDDDYAELYKRVVGLGHLAVSRFDSWAFGIENVSRTLTHQLVRKTVGVAFAQESMRYASQAGNYKVIIPESLSDKVAKIEVPSRMLPVSVINTLSKEEGNPLKSITLSASLADLAELSHNWYESMQEIGVPNEDARFGLLEASKTKILVWINSQGLLDLFKERCCCYDSETEVLTKNGWKKFSKLKSDDEFYSLNLSTGSCEYSKAKKIINEEYSGKMLKVVSQSIDLLVTPNHKNVVSYSYENKDFILDEATEALNRRQVLMKKNCLPIPGKIKDKYKLPTVIRDKRNQYGLCDSQIVHKGRKVSTNDLFKLIGFYISDGCCTQDEEGHQNIVFSKGDRGILEKYEKILSNMTNNSIRYCDGTRSSQYLTLHDRVLCSFIRSKIKSGALNKRIPKFVWKYDSKYLQALYEGLCDGDMAKRDTGKQYSTVSRKLASDIQRLMLHIGHSATITTVDRRGTISSGVDSKSAKFSIATNNIEYQVSINVAKNEPIIKAGNRNPFELIDYTGTIHCVELKKNNTLYVRRKDKAVWSGNSTAQWEIRDVANKMLAIAKEVDPNTFAKAGPKCAYTGVCIEQKSKWEKCQRVPHKTSKTDLCDFVDKLSVEDKNKLLQLLTNGDLNG